LKVSDVLDGVLTHNLSSDFIWSEKATEERVRKEMETLSSDDQKARLVSMARSVYKKIKIELDVKNL
jgi:hypothetical protein